MPCMKLGRTTENLKVLGARFKLQATGPSNVNKASYQNDLLGGS